MTQSVEQLIRCKKKGKPCSQINRQQLIWSFRVDVMQLNAAQLNYFTSAICKASNHTAQADNRRKLTHSLSGDTSSSGACCVQVRSIRACFYRGDGILEQASTHHTDYTKLNTALCQHGQEADQSVDVRTERRSLLATGYMSAGRRLQKTQ